MGILISAKTYLADPADLRKQELEELTRPLTQSEVLEMLIRQQVNSLPVDDDTAVRMTGFFPEWASGEAYPEGYKVQNSGALWKCLAAHTSTDTWSPTEAPSLWAKVLTSPSGQALPWEQPDSTNAYATGDKVSHAGKLWVSSVEQNVWEPGVYGWDEIKGEG